MMGTGDARARLIAALLFIVAAFLARTLASLVCVAAVAAVLWAWIMFHHDSRWRTRISRPLGALVAFIVVFDALFAPAYGTPLATLGPAVISAGSLLQGALDAARLMAATFIGAALVASSSREELARAAADLLVFLPLAARERSYLVLMVCFQAIPAFLHTWREVREAQELRGLTSQGSLLVRARSYLPLAVPLFNKTFSSAHTLARSLVTRGYDGTPAPMRQRRPAWHTSDVLLVAGAAALTLICALM